eukprot:TRINITY_DN41248_c0_g1_i1.p3 TRINITY_DN41248_c0_g1~~TRINITY_DN41248_c0_g1_i1.p3  ORF type:complete len:173 (+),score=91.52 TRINITY_DN41248_c0_g1_i1:62-580(+)
MQEVHRLANVLMLAPGEYKRGVRGRVVERWKLREREFCSGTVFNVALREDAGASAASEEGGADALLYFRDRRAEACSFIEVGDVVSVDAVVVEPNPAAPSAADAGGGGGTGGPPLLATQRVLVCPDAATVTVVQTAGATPMELVLRPGSSDPEARVLPAEQRGRVLSSSLPK